jgi:hypothetical protein
VYFLVTVHLAIYSRTKLLMGFILLESDGGLKRYRASSEADIQQDIEASRWM